VAQHYILCIQTFTKSLGWHVVALNNHIGVGDLEPVGSAVGAIIASPFHDKFVNFFVIFHQYCFLAMYTGAILIVIKELASGWPKSSKKPL